MAGKNTNISKLIDEALQERSINKNISDKAQFIAMRPDISHHIKNGVTAKFIWEVLKKNKVINYSYPKFSRFVRTHIKNKNMTNKNEILNSEKQQQQNTSLGKNQLKVETPVSNKTFHVSTIDESDKSIF